MIAEVAATRFHDGSSRPLNARSMSARCAFASAILTLNMVVYWILDVTMCTHGAVVVPGLLGRIARERLALGEVPCAEGVIPWV